MKSPWSALGRRKLLLQLLAFRRPTVGLILVMAASFPFMSQRFAFGESAPAILGEFALEPSRLRILSPADATVVGNGNYVLVEGSVRDSGGQPVDRLEIAIDSDDAWTRVDPVENNTAHWRYLWADPPLGFHRIRARAVGVDGQAAAEDSIIVQVADTWTSPFIIDNPYASPGTFRKGQLHAHSTNSSDAWTSLPPAEFALEYKKRGYQFVVLTDHDRISNPPEINDSSFIAIPGYESTSATGHITGSFVEQVASSTLSPQQRIDHIVGQGGLAILAHPSWRVGWTTNDLTTLTSFTALEISNGLVGDDAQRVQRHLEMWHEALSSLGRSSRVWAVAVDDAHKVDEMDRGWVMVKSASLTAPSIRQALRDGSFYASTGPRFDVLGVLDGQIVASSPDARTIRFIDQNMKVVIEGPAAWTGYRPTGSEHWIRVEAIAEDGRTAWSQPFWLAPNAPTAQTKNTPGGWALEVRPKTASSS
ncbi:MAG: hypothetical protein GEU73_13260 [Chloroflexi bacterium]|nr:hypothetical protein [Chloroflexota bacterium]